MQRLGQFVLGLALLAYPFLVYLLLPHFSPRLLGLMLLLVLGLRALASRDGSGGWLAPVLAGACVALLAIVLDSALLLQLYPVLISLCMLLLFAWSLWHPPTVIERFARRFDKNFTDANIPYVKAVTQVWCVFFAINASISLFTVVHGDARLWTLYNGLLSYLLMGLLFAGEWCVRQWLRSRT